MHVRGTLTVLLLLTIVFGLQAQNFDADSIYYTPIPLPAVKPSHKKVLRTTVTEEQRFTYFFNLQVGTLIGCSDCDGGKEVTFTTSTTHGVSIGKKLRVGAGIGFDSYSSWTTLPLFGSASWDILGAKNTNALYVQLRYGWAESWQKNLDHVYGFKSTGGGRMADIQVGYRITHHTMKIAFSVGTKFQRVFSYYEYPIYQFINGRVVEGPPSTKTVQQDMSRMMLTTTIGWK